MVLTANMKGVKPSASFSFNSWGRLALITGDCRTEERMCSPGVGVTGGGGVRTYNDNDTL